MKTNKIFVNKFTKNHEDNKEEYYKHLSNISGLVNDSLFRSFSYDLFADGRLISFDYSFLKKQIVMIIGLMDNGVTNLSQCVWGYRGLIGGMIGCWSWVGTAKPLEI